MYKIYMSKKSLSIKMSSITKDGRKLKNGGFYLTKEGKLREKFKGKFAIYDKKLYNTKTTKKFTFNNKKNFTGLIADDLKDEHGAGTLGSATLLEDLAKKNNITGDNYIVIKKNNNIIFDGDFDIDNLSSRREDFNAGESPFKVYNNDIKKGDKIEVIFSKNKKIPKAFFKQKFLDGKFRHCFFQDILDYYEKKIDWCEENDKSPKKYKGLVNKIKGKGDKQGDLEKYKNGITEEELTEVCSRYGISVQIFLPFQKDPIIEFKSPKNSSYGKTFKYTNTRLNHLEYIKKPILHTDIFYRSFNPTEVDFNTLQEIVADLHKNKELALCKKGCFGYLSVKTKDNFYVVKEKLQETIAKFEKESGIEYCDFDAVEYPLLEKFITMGTHFNGTVDFMDTTHLDNILTEAIAPVDFIKHIDQTNAYTQFKNSKFYCGFVGKITDFRKCSTANQVGFYYISDLDFTRADKKFIQLNKKLNWFVNNNIYTKQELDALNYYNVKYKIEYGAYGVRMDFDFPKYMFDKHIVKKFNDTFKIPYYAIWTGMKASSGHSTSYYMKGDHRYFGLFNADTFYNDISSETKITFKNPTNRIKKHFAGNITAYQRLIMLEQLMEMDLSQIYRVCVDGIYYNDHKFNLNSSFREKTKLTFRNSPSDNYLSNIFENNTTILNVEELKNLAPPRPFYKTNMFIGAGGTGKSYDLLNDTGFIHPVYIAPTWKLSAYPKQNIKRLVHCSINEDDNMKNYSKKHNVGFFDEGSMGTEYNKNDWFRKFMGSIYVMGDLECQLSPVISDKYIKLYRETGDDSYIKQMTLKDFDYIRRFTKNYRFKCNELLTIANSLRDIIINSTKYNAEDIINKFNVIRFEEVIDYYDYKKDIILVARNEGKRSIAHYNEIFPQEKYKIKENKSGYYNGSIVFSKIKGVKSARQHGFTIHSVQGETYDSRIFIDIYHMINENRFTNLKMFYTAISRARTLDQIFIIY